MEAAMNISLILGLFFSPSGWTELQKKNLSIPLLAWALVVPMSFLPPVLLYYAGTHYDDSFLPGFGDKNWHFITTTLFLAELLTFFVMGWLIYAVLDGYKLKISYDYAYLVAAIAPMPLWLSSLALLVPVYVFSVLAAGVALILSIILVYQACRALNADSGDDVVSMSATYSIIAASFMAWVLLLVIIWAY